jgi:hypothetical protein
MKKPFWIVLILCIAAYSIFAEDPPAAENPYANVATEDLPSGVIQKLTGKVQIKPLESSAFVKAKVGDVIKPTTVIQTAMKSTAVILVGTTPLNVAPLSRLTLEEMIKATAASTGGKLSCCE